MGLPQPAVPWGVPVLAQALFGPQSLRDAPVLLWLTHQPQFHRDVPMPAWTAHRPQSLKGTFSSTEHILPRQHLKPCTQQHPLPQPPPRPPFTLETALHLLVFPLTSPPPPHTFAPVSFCLSSCRPFWASCPMSPFQLLFCDSSHLPTFVLPCALL